ncbi:response regulator transcription factor [Massilia sp. MB5]|uniref:response regulator transcription factor n=1 Tax=unclassified Massilia TaxID=2609279 RepID=UPI00067B8CE4|nr:MULTISPECIES: response regulator transcription factor [unclassified Massilia]AKU22695.1 LuxR family transcriptional regulator [Massilia sp. NR 4-1]UMR32499.1 response regulator transcription factor [Massilia sp. MB5]
MEFPAAGSPIRILIVDDHPLLRAGLAETIASQPDMCVAGEAENGVQALAMYPLCRPDVTVMDIAMPEMCGVTALLAIRRDFPAARIVMLTTYKGDAQIQRAVQGGAAGFLLKSSLRRDLLDTIRAVHAGQRRIPSEIAMELAEHMGRGLLSEREAEVLCSAAAGNSNKRIALHLAISEETVKAHMRTILAKLGANDRTHAVTIAFKRGMITL